MLQHLPLKFDFQENESILKCLYGLYRQGNQLFMQNLNLIIKIVVHIYHNKETPNDDVNIVLNEFLQTINSNFPQEFANVVSSMGNDVTQNVQNLFNS